MTLTWFLIGAASLVIGVYGIRKARDADDRFIFGAWAWAGVFVLILTAFCASAAASTVQVTPSQRAQIGSAIRDIAKMPCVSVVHVSYQGGAYKVDCGGAVYRVTLQPLKLERW